MDVRGWERKGQRKDVYEWKGKETVEGCKGMDGKCDNGSLKEDRREGHWKDVRGWKAKGAMEGCKDIEGKRDIGRCKRIKVK
jgi:hypothetical protein